RAAWAKNNPLPLRERLVAEMPRYAPYARRLAGLTAAVERLPPLSRWLKRGLGLAEQRALPRFDGDFLATASASPATSTREVLLFVDTFNNYMEPENARAACRVL